MSRQRPPRIAAWLLRLVCRDDSGRDAAADLAEEFEELVGRHGIRAARRWYRRQVARSVADRLGVAAAQSGTAAAGAPRALWRLTRVRTDVAPALRSLRRAPWYSATVVAVVALALSLATTVFAVVDGVLFKPLPYEDPDRLVLAAPRTQSMLGTEVRPRDASIPDLRAWREAVPEVQFTATTVGGGRSFSDNEFLRAAEVDRHFFDVLAVRPLLGGFTEGDFGPATSIRPVLLTYEFWRDRLGGDPDAIGRVFADSTGDGVRVAGVLRPDFLVPHPVAYVLPPQGVLPLYERGPSYEDPQRRFMHVIARVPDDLALEVAAERLTASAARVAARFPPQSDEERAGFQGPFVRVDLVPVRHVFTARTWVVSSASLAAAGFLVLLACLNLVGLASGRVLDRRRELSMRRALGARAIELIRVLAVENAVLLVAGSVLGVVGAWWMLQAAPWLLPDDVTILKPPIMDGRVVAFAATACTAAVAMVTLWSSRAAFRADLRPALAGASGATERARSRGRVVIVGGQVSLALAMVVTGSLFATSLARLWSEDVGFDTDRVADIYVSMPLGADLAYYDEVLAVVRRVPGVTAAGGLGGPFLQRAMDGGPFAAPPGAAETGLVEHFMVTSGLLDALGLRPLQGRWPTADELTSGRPVIVVSETVARAYFPDGPAVGRTLTAEDAGPFEIVGVVPDVRYRSLDTASEGEIYSPMAAWEDPYLSHLLVSYDGDVHDGIGATVRALTSQVPSLRLRSAMTLRQKLGTTVQSRQFQTAVFVGFGVASLAIVSAGVLGLIAMTVARRTREVGIRMALGATPSGVVGMIVREHLTAVAAGLALGTLGAVWAVRAIASYLYEMSAYDWRAWSVAVGVLLVMTMTAALVPSFRASRVDPVRALRTE